MTGVAISAGRKSSLHSVAFNDPAAMADAIMLQPSAAEQRSPRLAPHGTPRHEQGGGVHALHFAAAREGTSRIEEPRAARGRQVARHTVASNGTMDRSKLAASHPPIKLLSELTFAIYESSEQGDQACPLLFSRMIRRR